MQSLPEIFRRNRTVILLFTVLVIMPSLLLGYLGFRAVRSDNVEHRAQQRNRQREIALLLNGELKSWLFSPKPDGAASQAFIRFTIDGDRVVFPDYQISIPLEGQRKPVPFNTAKEGTGGSQLQSHPEAAPSVKEIEDIYYPRIQFFLRDLKSGQNSGAQYFRRLNSMIVQGPGTASGYIVKSPRLVEFSQRKLDELTTPETFRGLLQIDEPGEPTSGGEDVISLNDFTFFHVTFKPKDNPGLALRANMLLYSAILLITVLGGLFLYRAVSSEVAVVQLRADFVSAVSHEFRTPLSSMLALLERVESGHVVEKDMLARYHQTLRQEARRLGLLVDKLLDFAQIEAGKKKLSFERVEVDEVVAEAIEGLRQSSVAGHVEQTPSAPGAHIYVDADRTAIIHCVHNLIENAVKYSPPGAPVIVRSGQQDGEPFVEVIDQGIGIPVREQKQIFEKFYRAGNAKALNVYGTGIGLALVQRIMDSHGGSVTVVSAPGKGSCFRLVFAKCEGDH
jgi:signal transduction histidine kinase